MKDELQQGKIKQYDPEKGFGFISSDTGEDVFAHFSEIQSNGFKVLNEGQRVQFTIVAGKKGPQASSITVI